jgi:hypothetical protein
MAKHSYLEAIEQYFTEKRGNALILSPKDWPLVTSWQEQGIPLEMIYAGIDRAFARLEEHPNPARRRSLRTLAACKYDVEKLWKEHQETLQEASHATDEETVSPFQIDKQRILTKVRSVITQLRKIAERPKYQCIADNLLLTSDALEFLLPAIEECGDEISLSQFLQQIRQCEQELVANLKTALPLAEQHALQAKVEAQLAPYKRNMKDSVYQETLQIALLKALRDAYPLPSFT